MSEKEALFEYTLRLGDDSLILGHRMSEWCGHGPILEEDIAMTNISLDLIGQATSLLDYAGQLEGKGRDGDALAFLRYEREFRNVLLVEQPNGDFGQTMVRQFFFDVYRKLLFELLVNANDTQISAIAEKSLKETKYHLKHSSEWVIRLGDGTEESKQKAQNAVNVLMRYTSELFFSDEVEQKLIDAEIIPNLSSLKEDWWTIVNKVMEEATLTLPTNNWKQEGGRVGYHSENLGFILAELQYMQRAYPNMKW